jgi:hypothetical protein
MRLPEFKRAFGDSFVRGLQTGGEFEHPIGVHRDDVPEGGRGYAELAHG